ncbi:alpha/beta hydrolase family protein [Thermaerobacillus caldiproteolyticus]|uniref:alpha/beta hydrolase family protein n=1 Tax=Thermaerobacillus caldiproteolyticus TaxID=247480 RepID=UPI00188A618F|nr:alpha/beta fold hydrolase [Anoxybacillus caldiproteolyticus]QPA32283.1 alpha/beta fold hydrolase [Anoxybacillus caldiproteolyticus]
MEQFIHIPSGNTKLAATIHYPAQRQTAERYPLIIICHGFLSTRIGVDRLFVQTARHLAEHGSIVVRFDYGGCGESSGDYGKLEMDDLIQQTKDVIDSVLSLELVDQRRLTLLGHSLGGAVALLTAVADPRVQSLVLWAAVAKPFTDITRIVGENLLASSPDGGVDYCGYRLTRQFFESLSRHQPLVQTHHFSGNVLLVHGTDDEEIPVDYCFLYERAFRLRNKGKCDKEVILGANHTFSSIQHRERLLHVTTSWLDAEHRDMKRSNQVI